MIKHRAALLRAALVASDFAAVLVAFVLASQLRFGSTWVHYWISVSDAFPLAVVLPSCAVVGSFWVAGLYRLERRWSVWGDLPRMRDTVTFIVVAMLALMFVFRFEDVSRLFLAMFIPLLALALVSGRGVVHLLVRHIRRSGPRTRRVLLVGSGRLAAEYVSLLDDRPELGVQVVGYVDDGERAVKGYPMLGEIGDIPLILASQVVDEVAICLPFSMWPTIALVVQACEQQGKATTIQVDLMARAISRGRLEWLGRMPLLTLPGAPHDSTRLAAKRVLDIVGATALLVLTSPVMLAAALAILLTDGRPVIFRQERGGLRGRRFSALKFRTMVRDAEALLPELQTANERTGPVFKMSADPRVTRVGRVLRRLSVDELPQLFNVLVGQMSLVGPRPPAAREMPDYDWWHHRRLSVKPGLTGLWQISARSEPDFDRWVKLDLQYIDEWSLWGDVKLLAKTPLALIKSPGE